MSSPERVPFNDLGRSAVAQRQSLLGAVERVVDSGWFVLGPENRGFEEELASHLGVRHAIGVANGTEALQIALVALGAGPGRTVLTAANAGGYTSTAALAVGARPVFADVDPETHLLTAETLAAAWAGLPTPPDVVVVTHLYGRSADMPSIMDWADAHAVPVVEDCAQALGAATPGRAERRAGSWGQVATTSFYPTKNLGALGDGGAVLTSDDELAARARALRQYGWTGKYHVSVPHGINSRLDELQAAILRERLPLLDAANDRRRRIHARYEEAAAGSSRYRLVNTAGPEYVGHLAVLESADRDALRERFEEAGIGTDVHYPTPDHRQPAWQRPDVDLPVTQRLSTEVVSIPLFPELTDDEVDRICTVLREL